MSLFLVLGYAEHHDDHHSHDHTHDPGVSSVSIVCEGSLDLEKVAYVHYFVYCTFDLKMTLACLLMACLEDLLSCRLFVWNV